MNKLVKNSGLLIGLNFFASVLNYLYQILAARVVSISDFGLMNSVFSYMAIIAVPGSTLTMIAARELAIDKEKGSWNRARKYASELSRRVLWLTLAVFALELIFGRILGHGLKISSPVFFLLVAAAAALGYFHPFYSGCFSGFGRFALLGCYAMLIPAYKLTGLAFAALDGINARLMICMGSIVVGSTVTAALGKVFVGSVLKKEEKGENDDSHWTGFRAEEWIEPLIVNVCFQLFANIDVLIVRRIGTETESGLYSSVMLFGRVIYYVATSLGTVLLPLVATRAAKKSSRMLRRVIAFTLVFCILCFSVLGFAGTWIINLIYGSDYVNAMQFLPFAGLFAGAVGVMTILVNYMVGVNYTRKAMYILLCLAVMLFIVLLFSRNVRSALLLAGVSGGVADLVIYLCFIHDMQGGEITEK